MNIVIPMAGRGMRFAHESYSVPKPLISVEGKSMVAKVLANISPPRDATLLLVCLTELRDEYGAELEAICRTATDKHRIVAIERVMEGAACTVLKAREWIDNDEELVIANCDQLVLDPGYFARSLDHYRRQGADGGILCFYNDYPSWSYVNLDRQGQIKRVVEKQVVSNFATVGIYWYARGSDFVSNGDQMVAENERVKDEFYVAPVYNWLLAKGEFVRVLPFLVNDVYGIGTPQDLRVYERRKK